MKNLTKLSFTKVIKTGNIFEVYQYTRPYAYNRDLLPRSQGAEENTEVKRTDSILRAQMKVRRLVNANAFEWGYMPIFVTYTFAENLTDVHKANTFFKAHMRLLKKRIRSLRYLAVIEHQNRGAVHYHVVFFDLPYIEGIKKIFEENWPHGFIQIKAIKHVRNVGAYISKYFSKGWHEERPKGAKAYYTSLGLLQPQLFYSLDNVPKLDMMNLESETVYETEKYGRISYRQFRIIK